MTSRAGSVVAAGGAYAATRLSRTALGVAPPGGAQLWDRVNHRGEPVSLLAGPALTVGLLAGPVSALIRPCGMTPVSAGCRRTAMGQALAVAGAGAFGLFDDLGEDPVQRAKGLRGHLGALRRGQITTGAAKVLGIGASAGAAALIMTHRRGSLLGYAADVALNSVLIAGSANLFNLLDLRPGRALKAGALGALAVSAQAPTTAATVLGASGALIGADLGERDMLGDCGANALGAALASGAFGAPRLVRSAVAAGVVALNIASERVSFSAVISRNRVLRAIDGWGRR